MRFKTLVPVEQLSQHLDDPDWIVFDCRFTLTNTEAGRAAYQLGHIPGARYVHLDDDIPGCKHLHVVPGRIGSCKKTSVTWSRLSLPGIYASRKFIQGPCTERQSRFAGIILPRAPGLSKHSRRHQHENCQKV